MMPNVFAMIAGIGFGIIIVGAAYFFDRSTPHNYDENKNKRKKQNKDTQSCSDCGKISLPKNLISLGCGHRTHESCLYKRLIHCKASDLKEYKCHSCWSSNEPIPYYMIKNILCSRCCVCTKEFDQETCCLSCGHKLHKKCLKDNISRQSLDDETTYKCPYNLIECTEKMDMKRAKKLAC